MRSKFLSFTIFLFVTTPILADEDGITFFEKKIRPVLAEKCYRCHSPEKRVRGGLALDTKKGLLEGGDTGPAVVPGKVKESILIKAIRYTDPDLQMPPKGKMPAHVIADLEKWVAMGAPDPRLGKKNKVAKKYEIDIEKGRQFWSFQLPKKHPLPKVKNEKWVHGPIDRFVLSILEGKNIKPIGDADRVTLLRRTYFALIGLPPTPKQIEDFVSDKSPEAYEKVVDTLLKSPHFGERWGRHWLDVARFAESSGGGRSLIFPDAWRYRDYVIQAFNKDVPFDQFIREQIAGDLLEAKTQEERYWKLVATAFLILGPINYEQQDKPVLESDVIDEQLDTVGRTFMGMTIGCARCHDHKFDPIPTRDYYAMAGIFKNTTSLVHSNVSKWVENPLPMSAEKEQELQKFKAEIAALRKKITLAKAELKKRGVAVGVAKGRVAIKDLPGIVIDDTQAKKVGGWKKSVFMNSFIGEGYLYDTKKPNEVSTLSFNPEIPKDGFYEVRLAYLPHSNRATNTKVFIFHTDGEKTVRINQRKTPPIDGRFISLGKYRFDKGDQWFVMVSNEKANGAVVADAVLFIPEEELDKEDTPKEPKVVKKSTPKYDLKKLQAQLKRLQKQVPSRPTAMGVKESNNIKDFYICIRGNIHSKGKNVPRGFLQVATYGPMPKIPDDHSGRRELAEWLASPKNPLTARVMVNRIWHHLFGRGIVKTVDNLGSTGDLPTHPELLDYLAFRFVEQGWSVKKLIREIMLSHTYQLSSSYDREDADVQKALEVDVDNRLLWRQNRRRLEAEVIRDAMLAVSGQLELTGGGRTFPGRVVERQHKFTTKRRSVYVPVFRNNLLEMFEVFDFPDPNMVKGRRSASTVAPQALFLMNNPFVMEQASSAAKKVLQQKESNSSQRVDLIYRTALGRLPTDREKELALAFVTSAKTPEQQQENWSWFYQVLFSSIDFRYVN